VHAPIRLTSIFRLQLPTAIFTAIAVSTIVFTATPFLVPAVADHLGVSVGLAGLMSTFQLAGFVVATWVAGRVLRPRRRVLVAASLGGAASNFVAAVSPWFAVLASTRVVNGAALGLLAWLAWSEVFGDDDRVGDVAVIGPLVGTVAAPLIAAVLDLTSAALLWVTLGALQLVPLVSAREMRLDAATRPRQPRHRPTRGAVVVLACLGLLTFGGSAVFIFAAAIGRDEVGLAPVAVSLAFAANAVAGVPSARRRGERSWTGGWMAATGVAAILVGSVHAPVVFYAAMVLWGFAFWMGVPGAFALLAKRSRYADERAGDAQAVMAVGRVAGPLAGGLLYDRASPTVLGLAGGTVMIAASAALVYLEWRVRPGRPAVALER
jgi:DHA1 family inner membrane transport protein